MEKLYCSDCGKEITLESIKHTEDMHVCWDCYMFWCVGWNEEDNQF